jgi:hypothetical protein
VTHRRGFTTLAALLLGLAAVAIIATGVVYTADRFGNNDAARSDNTNAVECTADAVLCPDGTAVGREGPDCEFAGCPESDTNANTNSTVNSNTTPESTAGWITYMNAIDGYSLQYPQTWTVENHPVTGILITPPTGEVPPHDWGIGRQMYIKALATKDELVSVQNQSTITLNGVEAIQGAYSPSSYATIDTYIPKGTGLIRASWAETYDQERFRLILGSFKLTDPTAGLPAGQAWWKTFHDSQGKYSFRYPPEGSLELVEGIAPEVTLMNGSFIVNITPGNFDPNASGEYALQETLVLGNRTWYVIQAGDGPCIWHDSITNFGEQTLQIRAGQCFTDLEDPNAQRELNEFKTNTVFRNSILSTFQFTD